MNPFVAILNILGIIALIFAGILGLAPTAVAPAPHTGESPMPTAGFPEAESATTTAPRATAVVAVTPLPAAPTEQPPSEPALSDSELNTLVRGALVNILCTTLSGGAFQPISGSGVVIDSRGVILTNAHVGQFFLLRDYIVQNNVTCVVRTGSPAQARYTAELLYLPQSWIDDNASQIKAQTATGTGENDYAFVRITGTTNPAGTLPAAFPALEWSTTPPKPGDRMILAAYPAGLLGGTIIATSLYASSAFANVTQLLSYNDEGSADLFNIGGTIASQAGSSGGASVDTSGALRGIITTAHLGATTGASNLYAISLGHISRSLAAEGQGGIPVLLEGDVAAKAANFNATVAKYETRKLEAVLDGQ